MIILVTEGFAQANAEADVNAKMKAAGKKFESLGGPGPRQ
jgi:amidase